MTCEPGNLMNLKKTFWLVAILVGGLIIAPAGAWAATVNFTWNPDTQHDSTSSWTYLSGSKSNWSGTGSGPGHYYPGQLSNNSDTATISDPTGNPVNLGVTILLGYGLANTDVLTLSNSGNSLHINNGGILGIQGGNTTTGISNAGTITINSGGILRNDAASATPATHYSIHGGGTIALAGGTISSLNGGVWNFNQNVNGYGTIFAPVTNNATIQASGGTSGTPRTLTVTGNVTNNSIMEATQYNTLALQSTITGAIGSQIRAHSGATVTVSGTNGQITGAGDVTVNGTLNLSNSNPLGAHNFSVGPSATLNANNNTINLSGNFSLDNTASWNGNTLDQPASTGTRNLKMTGGTIGGDPVTLTYNGATFNLDSLTLGPNAYIQLVDNVPNAVFNIGSLIAGGASDPILDLNHILCYVDGQLLTNGFYKDTQIFVENAVPIPPSALLLGSGLLVLGLLGWRRKIG
jgi:hypothetical protein